MLNNIRSKNQELIKKYSSDLEKIKRLNVIKELLEDDMCFFRLNINDAYSILHDLEYNEKEIKEIYMSLISYEMY